MLTHLDKHLYLKSIFKLMFEIISRKKEIYLIILLTGRMSAKICYIPTYSLFVNFTM